MSDETRPRTAEKDSEAPRKNEPRWRKLVRVAAYAASVFGVAGLLAAGSAYGSMKDGAFEIGEELGKLDHIGTKSPIKLNGQPIFVGSQVLDMSVSETLDRAETLCHRGNPAHPGSDPASLDSPEMTLETDGPSIGKIREEREGRGVVVCFAPQEPVDGLRDKMDRYFEFFESGNLEDLGDLRYFFARATDDGGTHLVRVWTEGSFDFYAMTSLNGEDAPGSDPSDAPRPPKSRRLLSATADKTVYAVRVYETALSPTEIAATYDRLMTDRGWKGMVEHGNARVYQRHDVSIFVTPTTRDGRTLVSMLHMGYDSAVASGRQ
jgi:hypothetical protein